MRLSTPQAISETANVFLFSSTRIIHVKVPWVWPFVLIGVGIAFLLV